MNNFQNNTLKTDKYELTMLEAFIDADKHNNKAVFELFGRKLPQNRSYGVVAGTERAIEAITNFVFTPEDLNYLKNHLKPTTLNYLKNYKFSGTVTGYKEGDYWFPYAPILTIETTLGEGVILETLLLSIFNFDSAVASAASQMRTTAPTAHLMEFGSRRINEHAAVHAARAAYIGGFDATSNLQAGQQYGIPVYGTSAHAFTLAFPTEAEAFQAQINTFGTDTTLLVDTYNITEGINTAITVAGTKLGAIRIDSGNPHTTIPAARKQLNQLGATNTKIVLSGDLNNQTLTEITKNSLPIDSYGIGTSVVTGDGNPAAGFVYKLVEIQHGNKMVAVAKNSAGTKNSIGGKKVAYRTYNNENQIVEENYYTTPPTGKQTGTPTQHLFIKNGETVTTTTAQESQKLHFNLLKNNPPHPNVVTKVNDQTVWENPTKTT